MELTREAYWRRHDSTSDLKLAWRAVTARHWLHVLPGETVLELGAGSGLWTTHLASTLRGESTITAAVFNEHLATQASQRELPGTCVALVRDLASDLPADTFDYIVGTGILCHDKYAENLRAIYRLLKPGGRVLFFEANYWNPQVLVKSVVPPIGRWAGNAECQVGLRKYRLMRTAGHCGFTDIDIIPYDIVHPRTPRRLIPTIKGSAYALEHIPGVREICGTLYISAKKPGDEKRRRPRPNLARHPQLKGSTSVVVPCHNESMNIRRLVRALIDAYDDYINEIVIVNDNSSDDTAVVAEAVAREEPRVKVVNRNPPAGVGRALRDGYRAATSRYILSMDADFELIVPELRDMFDAIADGHDGAIGSRFSHEAVLVNYPVGKIISNRVFHLLVRLLLRRPIRDSSNNLKLYRSEILKELEITRGDFAANAETGLKPILQGYDIREVPISWINRTDDMGASSFKVVKLGPSYFRALIRLVWAARREQRAPAGDA
jgi:SAM-dependent methyltransferase/CTP:molybdopterin cytidylyltransferase MocA